MFTWHTQLIMFGQVLLAFVLGLIVGIEREYHHSPAGIRTYAAVCLGACVFGLISTHAQGGAYYHSIADPTRIAAQIVTGIGFLGAGVIFRDGSKTNGLTTAATIWAIAAVGLGIAFDMYLVAIMTTFLIIVLLSINYLPLVKRWKMRAHQRTQIDNE
jgi:putative Mg2+ transporter-C (MgtC) family protein